MLAGETTSLLQANPAVGLGLLVVAGVAAGIINSMAGGGSFLTLPLLMALGLPPKIASGTMRVAVLLQNVSSTATFYRKGITEFAITAKLMVPMMVGSFAGAKLLTIIDDEALRPLFGAVLVFWAILLIAKPGNFKEVPEEPNEPVPMTYVYSLLIGLYGGFMQAGVGFPLLALTVAHLGYDPVRANAIKVLVVLAYTAVALPVFVMADAVVWREGLLLAVGTMIGAAIGTRWQVEKGSEVVRWFVIVAVTVSGAWMIVKFLLDYLG